MTVSYLAQYLQIKSGKRRSVGAEVPEIKVGDRQSAGRHSNKHSPRGPNDKHTPQGTSGRHTPQGTGDRRSPQGTSDRHSPQGTGDRHSPQGTGDRHSSQGSGDKQTPKGNGDRQSPRGNVDRQTSRSNRQRAVSPSPPDTEHKTIPASYSTQSIFSPNGGWKSAVGLAGLRSPQTTLGSLVSAAKFPKIRKPVKFDRNMSVIITKKVSELKKIEHCIRQNNAIDIYEEYFNCEYGPSPLLAGNDPIKTVDVVRDPLAGIGLVNSIQASPKKISTTTKESKMRRRNTLCMGTSSGSTDESRLGSKDTKKSWEGDHGASATTEETLSAGNAEKITKHMAEQPEISSIFRGRGVTSINFGPGINTRKIAAAYSSTVFQCPLVDVPRNAYVWDISSTSRIEMTLEGPSWTHTLSYNSKEPSIIGAGLRNGQVCWVMVSSMRRSREVDGRLHGRGVECLAGSVHGAAYEKQLVSMAGFEPAVFLHEAETRYRTRAADHSTISRVV
ncbi:hypothetical protein FHG87_018629 [Trinorchestia longiramus]|nr:hypothetical protein FHG87_018629 [Trinorchestia longiramus]